MGNFYKRIMAATKTIYKLSWNPSRPMAVAAALSLAAVLIAPVLSEQLFSDQNLDFKVIWSCWFVALVQMLASVGGTLFFYEGVPRRQQFRILSIQLAFVFIFATISNTIYANELCEILSRGEMLIHLAAWGAVNIAAMICTLFVYRLEPIKVEVGSPAAAPTARLWLKIPPAAVPLIFTGIAIAMIPLAPDLLPRDQSLFRCTIPFFVGGQLLFSIVTVNWLLNKKTWGQKIRHALMIVATSMFFGTLCNLINGRSALRPGFRIEISAGEYLLMNLGAMLCVIGYFVWERIVNSEKAKRLELTATAPVSQPSASASPSPVSEPVAPASSPESPAVAVLKPESTPPTTPEEKATEEASLAVSLSTKVEQPEPLAAESPTAQNATKTARGQSPSPIKGTSKKQKSGSHRNGGAKKSGSSKGGSPKNNGTNNDSSSKKQSNGNGRQKGGGSQPENGKNGSSQSKPKKP